MMGKCDFCHAESDFIHKENVTENFIRSYCDDIIACFDRRLDPASRELVKQLDLLDESKEHSNANKS